MYSSYATKKNLKTYKIKHVKITLDWCGMKKNFKCWYSRRSDKLDTPYVTEWNSRNRDKGDHGWGEAETVEDIIKCAESEPYLRQGYDFYFYEE